MHSAIRRLLLVELVCLAAYLVVVFVWAAFSIPALDLVSSQVLRWILTRVFHDFGVIAPHATLLAVAIWAGMLLDEADLVAPEASIRLIKSLLVVALFVAGYEATHELLAGPGLAWQNRVAVERSLLVQDLRDRVEDYTARREFSSARQSLELLLRVDPSLEEEAERARAVIYQAEQDETARRDQEREPIPPMADAGRATGRNASELMEAARAAMDRGDYVTAHLEARRAFDLDPRNTDAWRLAEQAWELVAEGADDDRPGIQQRKREIRASMQAGRLIEAYYDLQSFVEDYPADPDIRPLSQELTQLLDRVAFFLDELESEDAGSAGPGLLVVQETADGGHELIRVASTLGQPLPRYGIQIEALEIGSDHRLVYHLEADSGRFESGQIVLRGIHRDDESRMQNPRYLSGEREDALFPVLELRVSLVNLVAVSRGQNRPGELNGFDLYRFVTGAPEASTYVPGMQIDLFRRLVAPISVVFSSLLVFAVSFRLRRRSDASFGLRGVFSVTVVLPLLAAGVFSVVEYGQTLLVALMILVAGTTVAVLVAVITQIALVALGLVLAIRATA